MKLRGTDWSLSLEQHSSTADCSLSVRHTLPHHLMHLLAKYEALLFSWYHVYFHTQVQHVAPLLSTVARLHAVLPHSAHQGVAQCELLRRAVGWMEQMRLQPPAPAVRMEPQTILHTPNNAIRENKALFDVPHPVHECRAQILTLEPCTGCLLPC